MFFLSVGASSHWHSHSGGGGCSLDPFGVRIGVVRIMSVRRALAFVGCFGGILVVFSVGEVECDRERSLALEEDPQGTGEPARGGSREGIRRA